MSEDTMMRNRWAEMDDERIKALEVEVERLRGRLRGIEEHYPRVLAERDALQSEVERFKTGNSYLLGVADGERHVDFHLHVERDALKAELVRLSGKTGFCLSCEGHAKEVERLREALEKIFSSVDGVHAVQIAREALSVAKDAGGAK